MKSSHLMKLSASNRMASQRRSKCSRNTRHMQSGGGAGGSVTFAPALGGVISNPLAYAPASNCQAAVRPGFLEGGYRGFHGLPGMPSMIAPMLGGRRKTKKASKGKKAKKSKASKKSRKGKAQRGGSYSIVYDGTVAGFPGSAGIAGVLSTGCSAPSQTAIPASGAADNLNSRSSYLWQKGGAVVTGSDLAAAAAPLAGVSPAAITVPTAGYSHLTGADSVGTASTGTKFMINVPGDGRAPACMKGGSRKSKKLRKSKKSKAAKSKKSKAAKSKKSKRN